MPTAESLVIRPGLVARTAAYAPWRTIAAHAHPWAFVALVAHGTVREECLGSSDVRGPGAVRIMPAGVPHANAYREGGARCFITEVHDEADVLPTCAAMTSAAVHDAGTAVSRLACRMYAEFRQPDDLSPLAIDGLLRELLVTAARSSRNVPTSPRVPGWLLRVRDRLHDGFPEAPSLRELSADAGVHPGHLVRVFRRHFGCAPAHYLATLRIERARVALARTNEPIAGIAATVGFSDQAHFTRRFKALVGTTPARYRQEFVASLTRTRSGR